MEGAYSLELMEAFGVVPEQQPHQQQQQQQQGQEEHPLQALEARIMLEEE